MVFKIGQVEPFSVGSIFLTPNTRWNDFSFVTTFNLTVIDNGQPLYVGEIKIGFSGQETSVHTYSVLDKTFDHLKPNFFSLGQGVEYYERLKKLGDEISFDILSKLRDVALCEDVFNEVNEEKVFKESLARYVSNSSIHQFRNLINAGEDSKAYGFKIKINDEVSTDFKVNAMSKPPSNVHAIIGKNGVGKSHLLRSIVHNIDKNNGYVTKLNNSQVTSNDFGLLLYFSMSVFEKPFEDDIFNNVLFSTTQTKKKYIGIYHQDNHQLKNLELGLAEEFAASLYNCLYGSNAKKELWDECVGLLDADANFMHLNLSSINDFLGDKREYLEERIFKNDFEKNACDYFIGLSSGHSAVLYYLVNLVELTENKTICMFDEPENYLHPPLLSAFVRVMSFIMSKNNSLAVVATHSPVLLQEVPRECIWKLQRLDDDSMFFKRPSIETFGESVSEITSDVFGLDLRNTGFYKMIESDAKLLKDPSEVMRLYDNKIGLEGRAVAFSYLNKE